MKITCYLKKMPLFPDRAECEEIISIHSECKNELFIDKKLYMGSGKVYIITDIYLSKKIIQINLNHGK